MNPLQTELDRLFHLQTRPQPVTHGRVVALVLELGKPADWTALALLWRSVQAELDLPAPAIAVNGIDGHQLWFALAEPVAPDIAHAFLDGLRRRFLAGVAPARVRLLLQPDTTVPAQQENGHWSAFVAPDLAAIFSDEPWLDVQPGEEAQARILADQQCISAAAFQRALQQLQAAAEAAAQPAPASASASPAATTVEARTGAGPRQFLLGVMNDPSQPMPLRIDAAKALLPYCEG